MTIYYIEYTDENDIRRVEAFKSRTTAQKRVTDMTKEYKRLKKVWQEYIITRRDKPATKPVEPPVIRDMNFDLNSEGLLTAFTYLFNRGK